MKTPTAEALLPPEVELTRELFWETYGDKFGTNEEQFTVAWEEAQQGYVELPYHHWLHARETAWEGMRLADYCEANGILLNRKVLAFAMLFHDYNFHLDPVVLGYDSKEAHSTAIFATKSQTYGFIDEDIEMGSGIIMATKRGAVPSNNEEKAGVRADLANIADDYMDGFFTKTKLLREEIKLITGKDIPFWEFAKVTIAILSDYLVNDLSFGEFDKAQDRRSVFERRAVYNLRKLARETAKEQGTNVVQLFRAIGSVAVNKVFRITNPKAA